MKAMLCKILSVIITLLSLLAVKVNQPTIPNPMKKVDLSNFTLTFEDEFEGELDRSVWSGHYTYGDKSSVRKGSYWNNYMAYTENGNLVIPLRYLPDGMGGTGAGWYTAGLDTDADAPNGFSQKFGYFECRCILPKGADIWSAFWMMNDQVFNVDGSGRDGTEVDIMESFNYGNRISNVVQSDLHWDGYDEAHRSNRAKKAYVIGSNPYEEFNTYGLEWNEDEYIFYINGKEYYRTNAGGVCQNPLYLILSIEMWGENGIASDRTADADPAEYIVDYVRVYQYNDLMN
ncbi:glycoside hydrolase family 16 [Ruminococcus sp. CAG:563]|nr:glycoside hydrolase family 16 [Ruminococcus sp. CAG:563]